MSHEFPDSYDNGHIMLKVHPDYVSRLTHKINSERLGQIYRTGTNRYKFIVSEFHSFQGVLAWISNLEKNPNSIPEPYQPDTEPFLVANDFFTKDTTRIVFWMIVIGTFLIIMAMNWLF